METTGNAGSAISADGCAFFAWGKREFVYRGSVLRCSFFLMFCLFSSCDPPYYMFAEWMPMMVNGYPFGIRNPLITNPYLQRRYQ